ncbi:unnamed protein product [Arctogadus glacialis]
MPTDVSLKMEHSHHMSARRLLVNGSTLWQSVTGKAERSYVSHAVGRKANRLHSLQTAGDRKTLNISTWLTAVRNEINSQSSGTGFKRRWSRRERVLFFSPIWPHVIISFSREEEEEEEGSGASRHRFVIRGPTESAVTPLSCSSALFTRWRAAPMYVNQASI